MAYIVVKTIKGKRYRYWQRTYRSGGKVKTENRYLGPLNILAGSTGQARSIDRYTAAKENENGLPPTTLRGTEDAAPGDRTTTANQTQGSTGTAEGADDSTGVQGGGSDGEAGEGER